MTCPLCVQWRCAECKSHGWPECCDYMTESEPYWPDGSVAVITENAWCKSCAEAMDQYYADHKNDPT